jgi:hypothetical protein
MTKQITLTDKSVKAGPTFDAYYSTDGTAYTFIQTVYLPSIGSFVILTFPNDTIDIKLVSKGDCTNSVIHSLSV